MPLAAAWAWPVEGTGTRREGGRTASLLLPTGKLGPREWLLPSGLLSLWGGPSTMSPAPTGRWQCPGPHLFSSWGAVITSLQEPHRPLRLPNLPSPVNAPTRVSSVELSGGILFPAGTPSGPVLRRGPLRGQSCRHTRVAGFPESGGPSGSILPLTWLSCLRPAPPAPPTCVFRLISGRWTWKLGEAKPRPQGHPTSGSRGEL